MFNKLLAKRFLNSFGGIVGFVDSSKSEFLIKIFTHEIERETKAGVCKVFTNCSSVGTLECTYLERCCQAKSLHPETCFSAAYSGVSNIENAVLTD